MFGARLNVIMMATAAIMPIKMGPTINTLSPGTTTLSQIHLEDEDCSPPLALYTHIDPADTNALSPLTSQFALTAISSQFSIPPPGILAILITMVIHPTVMSLRSSSPASSMLRPRGPPNSPKSSCSPRGTVRDVPRYLIQILRGWALSLNRSL